MGLQVEMLCRSDLQVGAGGAWVAYPRLLVSLLLCSTHVPPEQAQGSRAVGVRVVPVLLGVSGN